MRYRSQAPVGQMTHIYVTKRRHNRTTSPTITNPIYAAPSWAINGCTFVAIIPKNEPRSADLNIRSLQSRARRRLPIAIPLSARLPSVRCLTYLTTRKVITMNTYSIHAKPSNCNRLGQGWKATPTTSARITEATWNTTKRTSPPLQTGLLAPTYGRGYRTSLPSRHHDQRV